MKNKENRPKFQWLNGREEIVSHYQSEHKQRTWLLLALPALTLARQY